MSRYIWNLEEENAHGGGSDCDDMTDTGSGSRGSSSYLQDEDVSLLVNDIFLIVKKVWLLQTDRAA